jgi:MinD superfamily P-loop ATPase
MKQLVILSGKGGTGKTSVAAAFAHLASAGSPAIKVVLADADVDAANLELVLHPENLEVHAFSGGSVAIIDLERCQNCGICKEICRFDAILDNLDRYHVDPIACEGCAACVYQCPSEAIHMEPQEAGQWYRSESRYGPLFHAELYPAQENSGKLVTLVKQNARLHALDTNSQVVILDGPPGIGCPVIAAAAGVDLAVIVTEPTLAGVHDLKRILQTTMHFQIPTLVVINKDDIYPEGAAQIKALCAEVKIGVVGRIPFDATITEAMLNGEPVTAYQAEAPSSKALLEIWKTVANRLISMGGSND